MDDFEIVAYVWPQDQLARNAAQMSVKEGQMVWAIRHKHSGLYFYYAFVTRAAPERVLKKWADSDVGNRLTAQHDLVYVPRAVSNYDGSY